MKAMIVTDLHGNYKDFKKYFRIWVESDIEKFILTGDFIHANNPEEDGSVDIMKFLNLLKNCNNFHVLIGNHEQAVLDDTGVYKNGVNQTEEFYELLKKEDYPLEEVRDYFKTLPVCIQTPNKVFISHAGPPKFKEDYYERDEFLWNRPGDFNKKDLNVFLEEVCCNAMIVGHTPVDGIKRVGKQLIVSSSYGLGKKAWIELDLESEINGIDDILPMVRYLEETPCN